MDGMVLLFVNQVEVKLGGGSTFNHQTVFFVQDMNDERHLYKKVP